MHRFCSAWLHCSGLKLQFKSLTSLLEISPSLAHGCISFLRKLVKSCVFGEKFWKLLASDQSKVSKKPNIIWWVSVFEKENTKHKISIGEYVYATFKNPPTTYPNLPSTINRSKITHWIILFISFINRKSCFRFFHFRQWWVYQDLARNFPKGC